MGGHPGRMAVQDGRVPPECFLLSSQKGLLEAQGGVGVPFGTLGGSWKGAGRNLGRPQTPGGLFKAAGVSLNKADIAGVPMSSPRQRKSPQVLRPPAFIRHSCAGAGQKLA